MQLVLAAEQFNDINTFKYKLTACTDNINVAVCYGHKCGNVFMFYVLF